MIASPLELLHPDGSARRLARHGMGAARGLAEAADGDAASGADVLLLAPAPREARERAWIESAGRLAASVAEDGIIVAAPALRPLRASLSAAGFRSELELLHVPDLARSRYLFPMRGAAGRYALRELVPLSRTKRAAVRAGAVRLLGLRAPASTVFRRPLGRPPLAWLTELEPPLSDCTAILTRSWRPGGAVLVHRFGDEPVPDLVLKVGGGARREAEGLSTVAAGAARASMRVPALTQTGTIGAMPFTAQTHVPGSPASDAVVAAPAHAADLARAIAERLRGWNTATAVRRKFDLEDAERYLLGPARALAPHLSDGATYVLQLERLCAAHVHEQRPFVAAHNDLTAANVLVDDDRGLALVDWEHATPDALPLTDLAYLIADFAAAVDGYRDRPAAHAACQERRGPFAELSAELIGEAAGSLRLPAAAVDLCIQACWLHHARNELRESEQRGHRDAADRPFLSILNRASKMIA